MLQEVLEKVSELICLNGQRFANIRIHLLSLLPERKGMFHFNKIRITEKLFNEVQCKNEKEERIVFDGRRINKLLKID